MNKLILWDIDGTLMYSGGVAGDAMRAAMERVYGRPFLDERRSYAGKTDQQIIMETFAEREHADLLGVLENFTTIYLEELQSRRADFLARGRVLEGVVAALDRLAAEPVIQSVLTGNLQMVARFKLDLLGLSGYFDLDVGAYGSDHHRRADLVPIAAARAAQRYGRPFVGRDVVVIGDTPTTSTAGTSAARGRSRSPAGRSAPTICAPTTPTWCCRAWPTPSAWWRRSSASAPVSSSDPQSTRSEKGMAPATVFAFRMRSSCTS